MQSWGAPEIVQLRYENQKSKNPENFLTKITNSSDIFVLGIIFYYTLNDRNHLFGEPSKRENNILHASHNWSERTIDDKLMIQIIRDMTTVHPSKRPSADKILKHPSFWTIETIESFFEQAETTLNASSSTIYPRDRLKISQSSDFKHFIVDWVTKIDKTVIDELEKNSQTASDGTSLIALISSISLMVINCFFRIWKFYYKFISSSKHTIQTTLLHQKL